MKRKAEDEIDAMCRSVKKLKVEDTEENGKLIRCTICDMLCQEEELIEFCCLDCYYDGYTESDEEFTISE